MWISSISIDLNGFHRPKRGHMQQRLDFGNVRHLDPGMGDCDLAPQEHYRPKTSGSAGGLDINISAVSSHQLSLIKIDGADRCASL